MNLKKILNKDLITVTLEGDSKKEVIENLLDLLMRGGKITDRDSAVKCILDRESKMSTGIQDGIAIPHGKTSAVSEMVACVGVKRDGVDFESLDGKPSRLFIMTLSPENRTGPHVQFLAQISQILKDPAIREELINADSDEALLKMITE
ncbi:MAG: PTS sugar transporter subunit IIA [Spirochaetales bacterium]|nr:PTS sugar transporter subunit IIA [Spirochaetales bacterium]